MTIIIQGLHLIQKMKMPVLRFQHIPITGHTCLEDINIYIFLNALLIKTYYLHVCKLDFTAFEFDHFCLQVHQQRPESPTVTLTWHACK